MRAKTLKEMGGERASSFDERADGARDLNAGGWIDQCTILAAARPSDLLTD